MTPTPHYERVPILVFWRIVLVRLHDLYQNEAPYPHQEKSDDGAQQAIALINHGRYCAVEHDE